MPQKRLLLLASLYVSQGLPFGFFVQALPVLLRESGSSLEEIGLTGFLALPWALKFLWAPLVDRTPRRRSWIVPLQFCSAALLLLVGFAGDGQPVHWLFAAVLLSNLISSTQDIATDGLAVDLLAPEERGLANGIQVAGYRAGMILGGGVLLMVHPLVGWSGIYVLMAAILLVSTLPVIRFEEQPRSVSAPSASTGFAPITSFFARPGILGVLGLLVIYKAGDAFATAMLRPYFVDVGMDLADIGWIIGTVGFVCGLLGAALGGALVNRLGRKRALVGFALLQALTVGGYALLASSTPARVWLYTVTAAEHLASGMATAALFTCMMDWCRPSFAATDYTIFASVVVIATGGASVLSGISAGTVGYPVHFLVATVMSVVSVFGVELLYPGRQGMHRARIECVG